MFAVNYDFNERKLPMTRQLRVDLLKPETKERFARIQGAKMLIGREPDEGGIALPSTAVSRNHGIFVRLRTNWFYKDLGSTNGSWVNGRQAREGEWKLIRAGDTLQLADAGIAIRKDDEAQSTHSQISGFPALGGITLVVFSRGEFVDEFPVPDFGRALVVGGSQGDLQVEGTLEESPNLVIERRSMHVCAYGISKTLQILHNDNELQGTVNLSDRDEIRIGHFYIIFNNPEKRSLALAAQAEGQSSIWKEWSNADNEPDLRPAHAEEPAAPYRAPQSGMFGRTEEDLPAYDETVAIRADEVEQRISGYDSHPSMRYAIEDEEPSANLGNLDEKIIFFIGILLLLGLIGLMMYWLLG